MNAVLLSSLVLVCSADDPRPEPKLPVGRETTFVTGPLDKNGFIDYEAALNDLLGKGVSPDKNANALIWKALGPSPEGGKGLPPEYFRRLGIVEPAKAGEYFIDGRNFAAREKLNDDQARAFYDQQTSAARRVWAAKDAPHVAAWLAANEKPLAVVREATNRPLYFNPLVSNRKDDISCVIGCLLPSTQKCRELALALAARATLRTHEGKLDDAWADLTACHRLGRHLMHGATFIECLVGIAVRTVATNATLAYLEKTDLTSKQLLANLKELQDLPPLPVAADKMDVGQRLVCLDALQLVRSGKSGEPGRPTAQELRALDAIDWAPAFRKANKLYDRLAATMRQPDRATRERHFDAIETELEELVKKNRHLADLQKEIDGGDPGKFIGSEIGDILLALTMPGVRKCQSAFDRGAQIDRNLCVAFALAAHRKDTGKYPAKLADLAPKYLMRVPDDLFTGAPLVYSATDKGYLLYSLGENGKDDGGQTFGDDPAGDDLVVRVPLPPLKK